MFELYLVEAFSLNFNCLQPLNIVEMEQLSHIVNEPLDLLRLSLEDRVLVKCKGSRELLGILYVRQALTFHTGL